MSGKNIFRIGAFALLLFLAGSYRLAAADAAVDDALQPVAGDIDDFEPDTDPESAAQLPDTTSDEPMDPALDRSAKRGFRAGTILEYWLLKPGEKFARMSSDPSLTGMVDESRQYFYAGAMAGDPELKNYLTRQGVVQWTTYFRATRAGKHVFAVSASGMDKGGTAYSGIALLVNDSVKLITPVDLDDSAVVDFSAPGWYKLQLRLWWSHQESPNFEDYAITLKVKEPGTLSLRQLNRKDLFYKFP